MTRSVVYGPSVTLDAGGNKWTNLANGVSASDAATVGQIGGSGVTSIAKSGSTALTGAVTLSGGTNVTLTQSGQDISIASSGGGGGGLMVKLYDYEVSGSDKASIDTNVDGTTVANFSGYDVIEVWTLFRTDDTAAAQNYTIVVNNDTSSIYDWSLVGTNASTLTNQASVANAAWSFVGVHGAGGSASYAGVTRITLPFPNSTTFWKSGELSTGVPDATLGNNWALFYQIGYRSTSAIARLKFAPVTGGKKFVVGSRVVIYGR